MVTTPVLLPFLSKTFYFNQALSSWTPHQLRLFPEQILSTHQTWRRSLRRGSLKREISRLFLSAFSQCIYSLPFLLFFSDHHWPAFRYRLPLWQVDRESLCFYSSQKLLEGAFLDWLFRTVNFDRHTNASHGNLIRPDYSVIYNRRVYLQ